MLVKCHQAAPTDVKLELGARQFAKRFSRSRIEQRDGRGAIIAASECFTVGRKLDTGNPFSFVVFRLPEQFLGTYIPNFERMATAAEPDLVALAERLTDGLRDVPGVRLPEIDEVLTTNRPPSIKWTSTGICPTKSSLVQQAHFGRPSHHQHLKRENRNDIRRVVILRVSLVGIAVQLFSFP
jgi:hypothetical protein